MSYKRLTEPLMTVFEVVVVFLPTFMYSRKRKNGNLEKSY